MLSYSCDNAKNLCKLPIKYFLFVFKLKLLGYIAKTSNYFHSTRTFHYLFVYSFISLFTYFYLYFYLFNCLFTCLFVNSYIFFTPLSRKPLSHFNFSALKEIEWKCVFLWLKTTRESFSEELPFSKGIGSVSLLAT